MKLKLCNNGLSVVGVNENGMFISYSIEAVEYKQWLSEGNIPEPEFTEEEIRLQEINSQIQEAKQYINDTGWIWEKYNRNVLVLKDLTDEAFYIKYSDIITKQEEYRVLINELEVQLEVING